MLYGNKGERSLITPRQLASALVKAISQHHGLTVDDKVRMSVPDSAIHFHDGSTAPIVFNDVQAIQRHNEFFGTDLPVPLTASEAYNMHWHSSDFDGGAIPGRGIHDHRDNFNGGFAFAIYHPGTALPQQPFAL